MKEEALKLAEIFEEVGRAKYPYHLDAAEMLRKLVEELDKVPEVVFDEGVYRWWLPNGDEFVIVPPQTKPLSDEEITYQFEHKCPRFSRLDIFKYAVKWAEERHGIK